MGSLEGTRARLVLREGKRGARAPLELSEQPSRTRGNLAPNSYLDVHAGTAGRGLGCGQKLLQFHWLKQGKKISLKKRKKNQSKVYLQPYVCVCVCLCLSVCVCVRERERERWGLGTS